MFKSDIGAFRCRTLNRECCVKHFNSDAKLAKKIEIAPMSRRKLVVIAVYKLAKIANLTAISLLFSELRSAMYY